MMYLSGNRLSLDQHLLSSELIIQLLCFPSRCLVKFSRILIKTHFQTPWMLISSKEIKTISTINIKLQLSYQMEEGTELSQYKLLGINYWDAWSMQMRKTYLEKQPTFPKPPTSYIAHSQITGISKTPDLPSPCNTKAEISIWAWDIQKTIWVSLLTLELII